MARPGLIVDRDGTLVEERGYITVADDLVALPGVADALARARRAGVVIAVVTNQSAVGRGLLSEDELATLHEWLGPLGVDAVYHCPHLPDGGCECRKPLPGLIHRAIEELDLDPARCAVVGDHLSDCLAGRAAGLPSMLVRTGHGAVHAPAATAQGFPVVADLAAAVRRFLDTLESGAPASPSGHLR